MESQVDKQKYTIVRNPDLPESTEAQANLLHEKMLSDRRLLFEVHEQGSVLRCACQGGLYIRKSQVIVPEHRISHEQSTLIEIKNKQIRSIISPSLFVARGGLGRKIAKIRLHKLEEERVIEETIDLTLLAWQSYDFN